jgi:hypothetical protein
LSGRFDPAFRGLERASGRYEQDGESGDEDDIRPHILAADTQKTNGAVHGVGGNVVASMPEKDVFKALQPAIL